jgi:DNA-binding NarL/FixJ family response regulator
LSERRGWRVLVVEDDDLFVERLRVLLASDRRFEVVGRARNGREAVGLTSALAPDLVLMDIEMPVMDGVEATRRIRASTPRVGIIAVSGTDFRSERSRCARRVRPTTSARAASTKTCSAAALRRWRESTRELRSVGQARLARPQAGDRSWR